MAASKQLRRTRLDVLQLEGIPPDEFKMVS